MVQLTKLFQEVRQEAEALAWEGTFREYLNMVIKKPQIARTSHARIRDMIHWYGVKDSHDGVQRYELFEDQVFGSDGTL